MFVSKKTMEKKIGETVEALRVSLANDMQQYVEAIGKTVQDTISERLEAEKKKRYDSDEPYIQLVSERLAEDGSVEINLDWNKSFIRHLKANGFKAATDDQLVDLWLSTLSRQIGDEIGKQSFK